MPNAFNAQDIRNRLSISTFVFRNYRPVCEKALAELAGHGFRWVEITQSIEQFDMARMDSMEHVFAACNAAGVKICAYHAFKITFEDMDTDAERTARIDQCKSQIDTLLASGGKIWGPHAREITPECEGCLAELLKHVEGTDAVIVLENFAHDGMGLADRMEFLDKVDHPQLGLLLDIGHLRDAEGRNPITLPGGPSKVLDLCASKLVHTHLHGFVDKDHYPPFAEGDGVQWEELFAKLFDIGYAGVFNFEPRSNPGAVEMTAEVPARLGGK